jgi:hypothetical protein
MWKKNQDLDLGLASSKSFSKTKGKPTRYNEHLREMLALEMKNTGTSQSKRSLETFSLVTRSFTVFRL